MCLIPYFIFFFFLLLQKTMGSDRAQLTQLAEQTVGSFLTRVLEVDRVGSVLQEIGIHEYERRGEEEGGIMRRKEGWEKRWDGGRRERKVRRRGGMVEKKDGY